MHKKRKKQFYKGSAKTLAAGLMCLASFVAPVASQALAADDIQINGAGGNGSDVGLGAKFQSPNGIIIAEGDDGSASGQGASITGKWNGWTYSLGGGGGTPVSGQIDGADSTANNTGKVTADYFSLASGKSDSGKGGALTVNVGSLVANTLDLSNNGGNLNVTIGTLNVTRNSTTLILNKTSAATVNFSTVELGSGNTFTVESSDSGRTGTATVENLNVSGASNTLVLDFTPASLAINALSFAGNAGLSITSTNSGTATFKNLNVRGAANTLTAPTAQLFGNVNLAANSALSSTNALSFSNLNVYGQAQYNGPLNALGKNMHFYLPSTVAANDTMLTVTGNALDISSSNVGVGIMGRAQPLAVGDQVTLIDATSNGLTANSTYTNNVAGMQGISKAYVFKLSSANDLLLATVSDIRASDDAVRKSPAEGKAASVALVTQGADLAAGQGMTNARAAANRASNGPTGNGGNGGNGGNDAEGNGVAPAGNMGLGAFLAVNGGTSRYNTGSHVDVDSISLLTGLAKTWQASGMEILGGVFFETGYGSYNSYNGLEGGGNVKGEGDTRYVGGGILARAELTESILRGLYAEASLRAGGMNVDYKSGSLPSSDQRASYDASASYYGLHAGLGYIWLLSDKAMLDLYAKYFWNHTTAMDVTILGDSVHFKAVDSQRTRLGGRLSCMLNEYITPYIGAAWDYEFDGKARSVIMGENAPAPALKGSTGVGELGLTWQPALESAFSVDLGVQGYTGMREGVSGNVQLKFEF